MPDSKPEVREVLTRVLGSKTIYFAKPIIDIASNPQLSPLSMNGVPPTVWENKERRGTNARTVLDPITTEGQELLLDFICKSFLVLVHNSTYLYIPFSNFHTRLFLYILECTSMSFFILI